jgi:hypothetical protein
MSPFGISPLGLIPKRVQVPSTKNENQNSLPFWKAVFSAVDKLKQIELQNYKNVIGNCKQSREKPDALKRLLF